LPEDVAAFSRIFPDVAIELEEQSSAEVLKTVEERHADFGICNAIGGIEHFERLPYRSDRLFAMVPLNHSLPARTPVCLADLLHENFIALRDGSALTQLLAQEVAHLGGTMNIRIRVSSLDALCRMVHVGLGLAIVPQHVGELYVNTLDVKLLPLTDPWSVRHLFLVFKARDQINASANTLINFLTQKN
ncbi:LysR substrate-binding domain-containing protein, partial [Pseudomonas sp.]|uniref:LysR substrate-binding domain-containing protein n=1 Tax=Pseudomonas sp. TaxID=306 RepID=UPI0026212137